MLLAVGCTEVVLLGWRETAAPGWAQRQVEMAHSCPVSGPVVGLFHVAREAFSHREMAWRVEP